jgi:hypothetical protein
VLYKLANDALKVTRLLSGDHVRWAITVVQHSNLNSLHFLIKLCFAVLEFITQI